MMKRPVGWGKESCIRCSVAVLGIRFGVWNWRGRKRGEGLQLAYLFPCPAQQVWSQ